MRSSSISSAAEYFSLAARIGSAEAVQAWFASPEFQQALKLRGKAAKQRVYMVEGAST
jgi:uncharacterized protein (DUF1330 family)